MNVLLVDDDRFVIAALQKGIDWESLGIKQVFTAYDIQRAQEILSDSSIDLLLSDIDMPHGSGLDLLGIIREQGNRIPTIFLTNYADFSYAKRALELRSFHYFLKPIDYPELSRIIKKALEESKQETGDLKEALLALWCDYLLASRITDRAFIQDITKLLPSLDKNTSFVAAMIQIYGDTDRWEATGRIGRILESVLGADYAEFGALLPYQSEQFLLMTLIPVMENKGSQQLLRPVISEVFSMIRKEISLPTRILLSGEKKIHELREAVESFESLLAMPYEESRGIVYVDEEASTNLIQYVDAHFTEDMSREHLSELFYFDQDYITKLFKKETGMSFKNYVIEKRLRLAKDLLLETDEPINMISQKVGYDNYSYFTRLFKKSFGVTPVEFRGDGQSS
ncbi:MAG: response regulator [Butyrivibrio sp.]|nr:response regulator [Butyrivibrio sp.]